MINLLQPPAAGLAKWYHRLGSLRNQAVYRLRRRLAWLLLPDAGRGPAAYGTRQMQAALEADLRLTEQIMQSQVLKYNAVFEALADGMLITDRAGVITEANPAACALWDLPPHRLLGRPYGPFFPPSDARAIDVGAFPDGRPIQLESTLYPATGGPVPVQVTALTFANAGEAGRVILLKNISDRRKTEAIVRASREVENAINYFATSLYGQNTVDEILWDIVKNCIARLGFVDCVVYLTDPAGTHLVQRAAYGPKNPQDFQILAPLVLPVGQGIVGSVARSGVAEIVPDTLLDARYVVDDDIRRSEITVPIIYQDKVIGIIDSEHPEVGFFQPQHLNILTTIASLCANKIVRVQAEAEARRTELQLAEYRRKMAEFKLTALRAQMNPHFVFNSLNSIQHLIAEHERQPALTYLSTFSRLLRQILESSLSSTILLSEEISILEKYLSLESLRFAGRFSYAITVDPALDPDDLELPALLVQPYVENALLHGLLNKSGTGRLTIHFEDAHPYLRCTSEDNGIGRAAAADIKSRKITGHKSVGMLLTQERLELINGNLPDKVLVQITDLTEGTRATGTRVVIHIPV
ncbi:MAG: histidine kinase [Cytophagales bacterium]|nr:histidine kinase [Cytophagales bacterium]